MPRRLLCLLLLAASTRVIACALTPVPGRDGVAYLWLAQAFAAGDHDELFAHVFHPFYPLLTSLLLRAAPGLDLVLAGQLVASACSVLTVWPLWHLARQHFGERAATWACLCFALGTWFARHPAECMSEATFQLLAVAWALALFAATPRPLLAGLAAGAAFLTRPEGAAFLLVGTALALHARAWRNAAVHAVAGGALAGLLPLAYFATGRGFVLTPKIGFNWDVGIGGAASPIAHYLSNLLQLPGHAFDGLGYTTLPLLLVGVFVHRRSWRAIDTALLAPFVLQCAVIPLLRSNLRFVAGTGVLLLPFAGAAAVALVRRRAHLVGLAVLLAVSEARLWLPRPDRADRTAEREVGRWLATRLRDGETIASDMPRLVFFAHRRPPPPRAITDADLLAAAADAHCRIVVWKQDRSAPDRDALARLGFTPIEPPAAVRSVPGAGDFHIVDRTP